MRRKSYIIIQFTIHLLHVVAIALLPTEPRWCHVGFFFICRPSDNYVAAARKLSGGRQIKYYPKWHQRASVSSQYNKYGISSYFSRLNIFFEINLYGSIRIRWLTLMRIILKPYTSICLDRKNHVPLHKIFTKLSL